MGFLSASVKTKQGTVKVYPLLKQITAPGMGTVEVGDVVDISLEDGAEVRSRYTLTRIALFGIFALGLKKTRGGEKFLVIETSEKMGAFEVDRKNVLDAKRFIMEVRKAKA